MLQPQFFEEFFQNIYDENKPKPFNIPQSIKFINIDIASGKPSNKNFITESFKNNFNFDNFYNESKKYRKRF